MYGTTSDSLRKDYLEAFFLGESLMMCHGLKHVCVVGAAGCILAGAWLALAPLARATLIVDDSWADGGRDNGADALDSNWWTSASSSGIEVSTGSLGLVTGSSGRGIHTVFPTQTLANVGDCLTATYTFTTPDTVGSRSSASFKVGLFDTLGLRIGCGHFCEFEQSERSLWKRGQRSPWGARLHAGHGRERRHRRFEFPQK